MKMTFKPLRFFLLMGFCISLQLKAQNVEEIDTVQLAKLVNFADSTFADEIMLIHKDKRVIHWKSGRCDSLYFGTASMSKSWTGLVIGIMIEQGLILAQGDFHQHHADEFSPLAGLFVHELEFSDDGGRLGVLSQRLSPCGDGFLGGAKIVAKDSTQMNSQ